MVTLAETERGESDSQEGSDEILGDASEPQHILEVKERGGQRAVPAEVPDEEHIEESREEGVRHAARRPDEQDVEIGGRKRFVAGGEEALIDRNAPLAEDG